MIGTVVSRLRDAGFEDNYDSYYAENSGEVILVLAKAKTSSQRRRGLLDRDTLPDGVGLYLPGAPLLHNIGMKFPIDVAWIRRGQVVKTRSCWQSGRPPIVGALSWNCLELGAGQLEKLNIHEGDRLQIKPVLEGKSAAGR